MFNWFMVRLLMVLRRRWKDAEKDIQRMMHLQAFNVRPAVPGATTYSERSFVEIGPVPLWGDVH